MLQYGNSSYQIANQNLLLNNILHLPEIKKNLLSVKKLCEDNNVSINFDSSVVHIKDQATNRDLLTGGITGGLYQLNLEEEKPPMTNLVSRVPLAT